MIFRCLALVGLTLLASIVTLRAQTKMPTPVEDDVKPAPASPSPGDAAPMAEEATAPFSRAMVAYKAGDFQKAYDALKGSDPTQQDDNFVILEAHVLAELKQFDDAAKLLRPRLTGAGATDIEAAMGDVLLRQRSFERASRYYNAAMKARPDDPDLTLKVVYCRIGAGDMVGAGQIASKLTPLDPKNPYDDHASYYFAHAAIARAQGHDQDADDNIQAARTNYGITVTNRYLKTYLQFFSAPETGTSSDLTPPPRMKPDTAK